jgi:hypothetical protein
MTTGVIDQNPTDDLRRRAKEVSPVPPVDVTLIDEPEVDLVNQCGRLQRVADSLAPKLARRNGAQLRVDERQQLIECTAVAATPFAEERRDVTRRGHQPPSMV